MLAKRIQIISGPVTLSIGEGVTIHFLRMGEKSIKMLIDAPKDQEIRFSKEATPSGIDPLPQDVVLPPK